MKKVKKEIKDVKQVIANYAEPVSIAFGSESTGNKTRRNAASTQERTDRFANIDMGLIPYRYGGAMNGGITNKSSVDARDAIVLCQKCYYNFAVFRNVIDLMTEFSIGNLYYRGGSRKSQEFFAALFAKINLWDFQDKFFREYYRSGTVISYRYDGKLKENSVNEIMQTFGATKVNNGRLPVRYIILNPADVQIAGNISFASGIYYKILTDYELQRLRDPKTEEDKEVFNSLSGEAKKLIKQKGNSAVSIPLDVDKINAVFYKKQDYEPLGVPMGFPVLEDINWKAEMKKIDMAIARTTQQCILLITMGAEPTKGGINPIAQRAMQSIFENESVGRVIVADYTTEAKFIIPEIADILDPKKYAQVNEDIQNGLNNILVGNDKFANTSIKVQIFVERLKQGRQAFLNNFLVPEIRRISEELGFKNYPVPMFEDINLKDDLEFAKVYSQLTTMGVLTPSEAITAIETGKLPTEEESVEAQTRLAEYKDKGFYQPLMGGPQDQQETAQITQSFKLKQQSNSGNAGRPKGTKSKKRVTPIGGSSTKYSLKKITDNLILAGELHGNVKSKLIETKKIKDFTNNYEVVCNSLVSMIILNEEPKNWNDKTIENYIQNPVDKNLDRIKQIQDISIEHQVDEYLAGILYISEK